MFSNLKEDHQEWLKILYFTPTHFEKMGALWPVRLGATIAKPHYHIGPRITSCFHLFFVVDGKGQFIQNGQHYSIKKNDIFCIFPQEAHEYYTEPDAPLKLVFLAMNGDYSISALERIGLSQSTPILYDRVGSSILDSLQILFDQHASDLRRVSLIYQLLDQLGEIQEQSIRQKAFAPHVWLQNGKEYIEIHYADLITIENVAKHVGIERTHFSKKFQSQYNMSPMAYLQQIRMEEAMLLLTSTPYKMSEIALSVGYSDLPTFSKAFKKINGMSPIQFRHRFKV